MIGSFTSGHRKKNKQPNHPKPPPVGNNRQNTAKDINVLTKIKGGYKNECHKQD